MRDVRQNKGSILKASVEYIRKLKTDQERKVFLEEKCKLQEYQNKKLLLKLQVRTTDLPCYPPYTKAFTNYLFNSYMHKNSTP